MRILAATLAAAVIFTSCKKDEVTKPVDPTAFSVSTSGSISTVKNLPADTIVGIAASGQPYGAGKYSFFSLETKQWIANSDSATTKWDLAFSGTTIRINKCTTSAGATCKIVYADGCSGKCQIPFCSC